MIPFREGEFDDWGRHSCARALIMNLSAHDNKMCEILAPGQPHNLRLSDMYPWERHDPGWAKTEKIIFRKNNF